MTDDQAQFFAQAEQRPEPKRNQWGQYMLPDPDTGEEVAYVRATTWCKTLADTYALEQWGLRQVLVGVAKREDLLALVQSLPDPDAEDAKKRLNGIAKDAKEAAGSSMRSNLGTAGHAFAEQLDMGAITLDKVPRLYRDDMTAYEAAKTAHGIEVVPHLMERVVLIPELGVAGTFDRLVRWAERPGVLVVLDLKTGRTMEHSWAEVIIQQALYSRAKWMAVLGPKGECTSLEPMPAVDQQSALIAHLPVGEALCNIYELPYLDDAWEMAQVAGRVRDWRKRKNLARLLELPDDDFDAPATLADRFPEAVETTATEVPQEDAVAPVVDLEPTPAPADRTEWLQQRLAAIKAAGDAAMATTREQWPKGVPGKGPWDEEQQELVHRALSYTEAEHRLAFPEHSDPDHVKLPKGWSEKEPLPPAPKNGRKVSAERKAQLRELAGSLSSDAVTLVKAWMREASAAERPWEPIGDDYSDRVQWATMAALNCAASFPEDTDVLTRTVLSLAVGKPWNPSWPTGAVFGILTPDQAKEVRRMALEFDQSHLPTVAQMGERAALEP